MQRFITVLSLLLVTALGAQGQIVITLDEVPSAPGTEFRYYAQAGDSFQVNIGNPGGPQVWDFSQGDTASIVSDLYLDPAQSPPQYSRANVVIQTSQLNLFGISEPGLLYNRLAPRGFILGAATTSYQGTALAINFMPYVTQYPLPLVMGTPWTNTVAIDQVFNVSGSEYRLVLNATLNHQVDAWGTVHVPLGSYDALRMRTNVTYNMTLYIRIFFVWVPISQQSGNSFNYDWRAENVGSVLNVNSNQPDPGVIWATKLSRLMGSTPAEAASPAPASAVSLPQQPDLLENYPNPFNAQTTLAFTLSQAQNVDLRVFDMLGRPVAVLAQGVLEAGEHRLAWAPEQLAGGVYVARLATGGQVSHHLMVYLK
ncbi:MAG: T9SS C-terminal target domain-containing protein [Candidatus Zixiibacteriota bacterium]|nr:MAG: T9SS C-terminal target domain-containing protein [candidate division Zixibacteria bacterium]